MLNVDSIRLRAVCSVSLCRRVGKERHARCAASEGHSLIRYGFATCLVLFKTTFACLLGNYQRFEEYQIAIIDGVLERTRRS